jgi:hypothetical protein
MPAVKKKAAIKKRPCKCVKEINAQLDPQGLELDSRIVMNFTEGTGGSESPLISLAWQNDKKRKKPPTMFCAYCPFCGQKKAQG